MFPKYAPYALFILQNCKLEVLEILEHRTSKNSEKFSFTMLVSYNHSQII